MIQLPGTSYIGRILPKEAFYQHLKLKSELKNKFVTDISRIVLENSLTKSTLNLTIDSDILEILVLGIDLKKQEIDGRILEQIARQNKHKILFWLRYESQGSLAIYIDKLYQTDWQPVEIFDLKTNGFSLAEIWNHYIEQIALIDEIPHEIKEVGISYRLKRQEQANKLKKNIERMEQKARSEKQPKKKYELAMQVQEMKKELEDL